MRTISQRELRNDNAQIMRAVEEGEVFTVTRRGVPVARITPYRQEDDLRMIRPATDGPAFRDLPRVPLSESTSSILDELRGDR